jgi:hypothetical protein
MGIVTARIGYGFPTEARPLKRSLIDENGGPEATIMNIWDRVDPCELELTLEREFEMRGIECRVHQASFLLK